MLKLRPIIDETIKEFIAEQSLIKNLSDAYGTCINVIFPENLNKNIQDFKAVYSKYHLTGKIMYAHKVNKSNCLVSQAENQDICIDVANLNELKRALNNGFTGNRIEITGPKPRDLILLGLKHDVLFNIDNLNELESIIKIARGINKKEKIKMLLRFGGFKSQQIKMATKDSKFGAPADKINEAMELLARYADYIDFLGFSFHLDATEIKEKIIAVENCLVFMEVAREYGFDPYVINIGGGFKANYLEDENEWNNYLTAVREAVLGNRERFTWGNYSFGLHNNNGVLKGSLNIYNYFNKTTGSDFLDEFLSSPIASFENRTLGTVLCENMIDLYIEPGRSIVDQTGITIAKIVQVKESPPGEVLAVLNIRRMDLVFGEQEIFIDPIVISGSCSHNDEGGSYGIYFTGSLCLESDLIYKRKIYMDRMPKEGDMVIFANTAGYYMDFNALDMDKSVAGTKLAVVKKNGKFNWFIDESYKPDFLELE